MIIQSLVQNLRNQNWFSVALEVGIVVFGVFIGLQVSNWNAGRQDIALERIYLERLLSDMEVSTERQEAEIAMNTAYLKDTDYYALHVRQGTIDSADNERLHRGWDGTGIFPTVQTDLSTISELKDTGNMMLIRNLEIRDVIGEVLASHREAQEKAQQHQNAYFAMSVRFADWAYVGPAEGGSIGGGEEIDAEYQYSAEINWERVNADDGAAEIISLLAAWSRYNLGYQDLHKKNLIKLRDLLRQKVKD